jgi:hypothetical protein
VRSLARNSDALFSSGILAFTCKFLSQTDDRVTKRA